MLLRAARGIRFKAALKRSTADVAVALRIFTSIRQSLVRSTGVPTAEALALSLIRGYHAILDLRRAHMDADHVRDLATAIHSTRARTTAGSLP